jgi:PAS domain S-box-containing protein
LTWREAKSRLGRYFLIIVFANAIWATGYLGEILWPNLASMQKFIKFEYIGIVLTPIAWFLFALQYSGRSDWISRPLVIGVSIIPAVVLISVWTNSLHNLHYYDMYIRTTPKNVDVLGTTPGPTYLLNIVYSYGLMLVATALILRTAFRTSSLFRTDTLLLVVTWTLVWIVNVLFILDMNPLTGYDLTPLVFSIVGLTVGYVIMEMRFLQRTPVATSTVINSMRAGIIVIDSIGRVAEINTPAAEVLGVNERKVLGKKVDWLFEGHSRLLELYQQLGTVADADARRDEARLGPAGDGPTIEMSVIDLHTRSGQPVGNLVSLLDIEDHKRAELTAARRYTELSALRYIDARMNSTLDVEHVLATALKSVVDITNADAAFIALTEEDNHRVVQTAGNTPRKIGERMPNNRGTTGRVIRNGKPELVMDVVNDPDFLPSYNGVEAQILVPLIAHDRSIGVLHLETSEKKRFTLENYAFAQMLGDRLAVAVENAQLYSTSQQQLEELRKLYEHVSTLEQTKTDMIRIASHDLRNPLGTVLGYLDLLELDKDQLSEEHQKYVSMMLERIERMQRIVNDILSLERFEAKSLTMRAIDLKSLVLKVIESCSSQLEQKSHALETDIPSDRVMVWADPVQIYEAIHNLLENAIKYTPDGGCIQVKLWPDRMRSKAVLEVIDNGYGVAEQMQDRLFEPFYRADRAETQNIEGTGLGLHLVKNIIDRHHGTIHFSSKINEGSTFGFEVVLAPL